MLVPQMSGCIKTFMSHFSNDFHGIINVTIVVSSGSVFMCAYVSMCAYVCV